MTEVAPQSPGIDAFLREATLAALQTLSALASDLSDANQARLAAAEILRFSSRRFLTPRSHPPRRAASPTRVGPYLSALSDLAGLLEPHPPEAPRRPDPANHAAPRPPTPSPHQSAPRANSEAPAPRARLTPAPLCLEHGPAAALSGRAGRAPPPLIPARADAHGAALTPGGSPTSTETTA